MNNELSSEEKDFLNRLYKELEKCTNKYNSDTNIIFKIHIGESEKIITKQAVQSFIELIYFESYKPKINHLCLN